MKSSLLHRFFISRNRFYGDAQKNDHILIILTQRGPIMLKCLGVFGEEGIK